MNGDPRPLGGARLGAYVDGELGPRHCIAVEAALGRSDGDRARLEALKRLDQALRAGASIGAPRWQPLGFLNLHRARQRRRRTAVAAGLAMLAMAGGGAWLAIGPVPPPELVGLARDAEAAYRLHVVASTEPIEPADVDDVAARMLGRLGRPIPVPNLTRWGFRLVGATLLATDHGTAVQLAYADLGGSRVGCLFQLRPAGADASLHYREVDGVVTAFGADSDLGYAMTARLPRRELAAIAGEVYGRDDR